MATEAVIPEPVSITEIETENKNLTSKQHDRIVNEFSQGELEKFQGGNNQPLETAEFSAQTENMQVSSDFGVEIIRKITKSNVGTSEGESFFESPSAANHAHEETCKISKHSQADEIPFQADKKLSEDEKQMQNDGKLDIAEETGSGENEVLEGAEERAEKSGMSHDILNLTGTSVQMATIEEPNFKIEEEKSLEEERILDRHVEVIANQHASVEENLKSIEKEFMDSQKVEKEMKETGETADFESGKEILNILEVTSGQNKEASIHGPDLTIDSMNKDGETVMEACKNEEGIIDTKFVEEGREETSVKEVEVKESEKNPDLVDEETGPEAIKPGETAGIEKDMKDKTLYDSIEDVSASTVAASPNIHNDAEAIIDIRESTKEELYKPPGTMATEVSSMIEAGPEFGEELKEVSDIACIEKSQDTVESSEKMENIPPVEDEMHDINKLDTSLVTETEKICLQAVDSPQIFKEVPEIKSEDIVKESPGEVKGQTEIHEKIAQTDSAASESKDYENPEEKADASFIKDEGMQSVREGLETTDTVVAGNDNTSDTEMIDAVENRQREMSKHEESPEESLLQQNEPENEKLERSLSMVSEDIHTAASSAYAETITCVTEETPIKSHEEGSEEKGMEDTQIQNDDGGENGIPKEENLPPTELSEKIGSVEAEITNTNPIDFHVTPLAEEAEQKECENLNKVSKFEHEEVHEANGASKGEEKHIEDNPEAFQCTNGAILEHTSTEGEVTTELTSKTNEMDTQKFQKLCELDSEENLKSKDAEENIEEEIQKEEDCNAETCQITTKSDDTVTTISDAETSVMVKGNVFARDETIEQNSEVESTLEAAPAVSCEDESNKTEDNEEKSNITTDKVQDGPEITGTGEAINEQIIEGNITCMLPELVEKETVQGSKDSEDKAEKSKGEDSGEQIIEESIAKEVLSPEVIGEGPVKNFQDDEKEGKKSEGEIFEGSETVEAGKSIAHETSQTVESPEDMLDTSMVIQEESRNLAPAEATPEEKRNEDTSSVIVGEENSTDTKIVEVKGDFEEGEDDSKQILLKNETREMFDTSLLKQEGGLQGEDKNLTPAETSPEEKRNEDRPSVMMTEETGRDAELVETAGNVEKCKEDSKQTLQKNEAGEMLDTSLVKQEEILQNEGKNLNLTEASPEEERNEDSVIRVEENGSYTDPVEAKGNVEKTEAVTPNPDKMEEGAVQKLDETLDKEGKDKETKDNDGTKDNLNAKVEDIEIVVETSDASEGTESIVLEPTTTMGKMESETSKNGYKLDSTKNLEGEDDMKNIEEEIKKETKEEYEGSKIASKVEETETHIIKEEYGDSDITPEIIGEETVKTSEGDEKQMPKLEVCEELQTTSVGEDAEKQILEEKNTNEENLKSIEKEFSDSQKNEKDMTETGETADLESGKEILNVLEANSGQNKEASFHGPDLTVMEAYKKEEGIVDTKFIEEEMEETCVKESEKSPDLVVEETGPEATKPGETAGIEKDMKEKTLHDSIEDVSTLTVAASPNIQNYEEATTDIKEGAKEELCKPSVTLVTDLSSMIVAGPEFDNELKEACDIACIEKSQDTIESSEKKENLPPVEDDMDDTNKSETSVVAETEKVCLQTADNPEIFKEVPEIRTESIVKESTEDVEEETEILEQIVQIGSTASEKGKDYENPEEKVDASFMKDEGMQSVGEGLDTTDASARENTNEGESTVVVGNDNISDTEIVAAVEQCQREMSKHEESPEESLLQQNEPRNEKLERSLSMVSEEIYPAATSATAETITCVSEETPVKSHEEDFEDKRKKDTAIQNDAAGETGILEEKNLPPVELNENTGSVEVKITNKNADDTHVINTLVEEEAEQKEWEMLDEVSKCEPEEEPEANGSSKQETKQIEDNSDACQSTNGAILEHASTEEAATRSLTSKTSEMDTEKLQVICELDSEEKSKNEEARENIEEAFQNKEETCATDIHEIATKTLVGDEAVIRDTEASVMIESNEFAGDDTIKQNFEVESILEAAPAVSGEDESNKAEDNEERNNIITEEVHDGPKITGTGEHTNEQIIIDNVTCLSPELVEEETVQSSQDKENKAEECEGEDSREHIIEKSNIEDISPEVVGEGPVKNFQDDGKEAEKSEGEIFEGSETAVEEGFQSEGKNLSPTEASSEEKRNEDTSSVILTEETGRDAELVETAGNVEKCEEDSKQILQKNEAGEMLDTSSEKQEEILQNEGKNLNLTEASPEEKRNGDSFIGAEENSSDAAPVEAKGNVEKGEEDLKQILQENETGEELERSLDVMSEEPEAVTQNADDMEEGAVQNVEETLEKEEKDGGIKDNNGTQDKVIAKVEDTEIVVETSNAMESVDRIVSEPEPTTGKMESETSNKGYELDSTENLESKDSRKNIEVEIKKETKEEYEGSEIASNGEKTEIHIIKEECGVSDITPEIIGDETVKSIKGDEDETKVEVYEELQTTSAGEDAEKQILEEKNTIEDESTVLNGGEKIEEISEEDNKVAKLPIQEGCEIIQTDDIGKQNIEEGSIAEDKENLGDEPVEEVQDGTKITGTGEATNEQIIESNITCPSPELIEEETVQSSQDNENKVEKCEGEYSREQIIEKSNIEDLSPELVGESPVKNFQDDGKDAEKSEGEIFEGSETAGGSESIANETSQTVESPKEMLDTSMVQQEESLDSESRNLTPTEASPEKRINEAISSVMVGEQNSSDTELVKVKENVEEGEDDLKQVWQENETGEMLETSMVKREEGFQTESKNLCPTEASPEEKINEDSSSVVMTEETGRDAKLVETAGNVEKCEEDSKKILQKNEAGAKLDTSLVKQEENFQNEGKNLNLTGAALEEKINEDSVTGAEENSSDTKPFEAKGNVEKGEEDSKQILQENETGEEFERSLDVMSEGTEAVTPNADDMVEGAVEKLEETLEKDNSGTKDNGIANVKDMESAGMESIVLEPESTMGKMESETSNKGYELDSTENLESKDSMKNIEEEIKKETKEDYEGSEIASNGEKTEIHIIKEECGVSHITPEIIGEEIVKSIKGHEDETKVEVYEELQTTSVGEDAEKQILEEKNTIEDQSTVLNGEEKFEEISEEDNKVAKMPIQEGCEIIQTDDIGKQNIEEGSIAEDKENLGDEPVEEVQDGTKITGTGEATNEQIIESNITCPSPELIEEETVQSSQDNENKVEKCEGEYSREQIIEKSNIEDLSPELVGESPVKNFQDDGQDAEKSEGEIFEGSETAGGSESIANETSQTVESPKEMLDTSMVQQEESLDSESRNLTPTEASPEKRINEAISSVMVGEQNSSDTELVKVKENVEEGEDDLKQVFQENETGEMLETSMVKREEGFQTVSKNLCPTEASPEEKINEDSSSVVMTEETGRDAKLVETAGNVEKCEEDSKQILQKNEAGAKLDTSLVKQEENFQNEGRNLNLTGAALEEKINEDSVIGAEENSSDTKPFEAKGNVEKGEEDSKQILQENETGEELERSLDVMSEGTEAVTPNADDMVEGAVEKLEETVEKDNSGTKDNGITNVKDMESGGTESIVLEPESTMGKMESETSNKGCELDSTENLESKDSMKYIEEEIKKETKEDYEGSEIASNGEKTEIHIIKEECGVSHITPEIVGEEIVKSIKGHEDETKVEVYEELQTTSVGEDAEKQILEEKNTIEDQSTVLNGEEKIEEISEEDNKVAKMPIQEGCEIIQTDDIGKQNIEEGSIAEDKENLGDEPVEEVQDGTKITGTREATSEQIVESNIRCLSPELIEEETVQSSQDNENKVDKCEGEYSREQIIEKSNIDDPSPEVVGASPVKNFQDDGKDAEKSEGEIFEGSETAGGSESIANETSQTVESPKEMLDTSMVKQEESLHSESRNLTPTEASTEKRINEVISSVTVGEQNSSDTELVKVKENVEEGEDDLKQILQENETGEMLETSMVKREEGFQTESKNLCLTEASPEEKINEDSSAVVMTEETGPNAKLVETAGNVEKCEEDSKQILQKNEAEEILDTSLVKQEENFQNEGKNLNLTEAAPEEKINEDSVIAAEENSSNAKPFEAKGNVEKGEEDSKQILQEYETGEELERSLDVMSEGTEAVTPNADDMVEGAVEKLEETVEKDNSGTKDNGIANVEDMESGGTESTVLEPESTMGEMESETSNKGYELDSTENLESKDSMKNIEEEIKKETKEECEGSETAGKGEETETHIIKEEYSVSDITPELIGEEIVKSIEGDENETQMTKVYEELQTTSVGEDDEKQILGEKSTIEDQFTEIEPSSKEDNKVAKMPKQEVCEIIETEDIGKQNIEEGSMAEGKENLGDEPEKEVCKEFEAEALSTSTEKENIEEHTKPGLPLGEETVKESSKEDESDAMQLKEEVQDCNSALIEKTEATGSVEETTSDTLTEPKNDSHALHVIKSREEDGDLVDNSSVSEMSEKDIKEEISAKRENTINDSDSTVMVETDGIIYREAEPEDKMQVESSNLASQEMDLAVTETKEAMLDNVDISAKPENSSNLGERRDEKIPTATDEAEEKMEYERQEEVPDAGSEGQKEQTTVETCSKDILGEDLKENPIMPSQEHQLMTTRASETTEETPTSFQAPYENIEAPFIAQATEELLMQKEDKPTASIDDSELTSVDTGKENEDEELQKHRGEDLYVHPELDTDQYISKSEDVENLKREETGEVAAQRDICESKSSNDEESSILELEKEKTEDEKPLDEASKCIETSVTCTDGEKDILEQENIADSVVDSSKEGVEVVNAAVEFEGGAHSHGHEVTKSKDDGTPTEENPVTDTLDERLKCASELVAEDQSNETLQESNKSKIEGNSNVIQDQEGEKEIKYEKEPKLEPDDLSDKEQNINETTKAVILSQEVHEGVEKADNDEIVKEHVIEEESGFNELHKVITKDETTNEVKDSSPLSTEYLKATDCKREATVEKESEEEKAKEGGSEKPVDVSSTPAEESEENFEKIIEETQSCCNKIDTATETAVTAETSLREAQLDDKPVKTLDISSDETSLETAETVAVQQGNRVDCMKLEETSCDLASQILANDGEHTQKKNGALENPDVIEDEEIKIACGAVYESKDRETKETDETGKGPTVEKLDADEIEEETEEASNIVPDSKSQGVEAVIEDEITDDQTLPAEKPEEQLQTPSPFEEQKHVTTTTVDREEEDKTKEAEKPEDESPEDSSATKTTEGPRELEVPILGLEVNDEDIKHSSNEVHEEERGTPDEVKVDREKVSETVSKSESQGIEAVIEDEITADQTVLAEASSATLLLKEQEYGTVTTKEKTQEKTKEVEMLQDETPENSSAPKTIEETCPLTEEPRELELSQLGLELDKDMHKECPIEVQKEEGGTLDEIKEEIKEASETVWQSKSEGVEAAKIIVDQTLPLEISEEKHQTPSSELLCKEQEHGTTRTIENMEEKTKEVEMLQDESPANSSATKTTEEKCYQMEESRELEVSCLGLELNKDLQKDTPNVVPEEECGILNEIKEEITETSETASESRPQGCEAVTKDGIIADERQPEEKLEEKHQTPSSALLSGEQEYRTITMIENVEENKKELEMPELGNLENSAAPKTTEETCLQNVEPRELEASKFGLEVSTDIQKDSPNETHVEETRILDKDVKLEPQEYKNEMKSESLSESEKESEKITELTRQFEKASSVKSETSEKAFESVSEIHGYEVLTKSEDTEIKVKHPKAVLTDLKAEDNQCEKTSEATDIIQNDVLIEQTKEENEDAKNCRSVSPGEETFKERNREFEPKAEEKVGEETFQNEELYEEIEKAGTSENIVKQIIAEEKLVVEHETIKATTLSEEVSGVEISQNEGTMDPAAALEVTRDIQQPEKISHAEAEPKVSIESISAGGKDVPIVETLQGSKAGDSEPEYATVVDSGVKEYEHGGEKRMDDLGEIKTEESTSMDSATISLCDLMQKSRKETPQAAGHLKEEKVPMASKEEMHVEDRGTVLEKDGEEEGDEHKKTDSSPDAPVMVEASKDKNVKVARKKSHNILSGVGSKVKHSFSKVKKAITGKSSHPKLVSPK